MRVLGAALAFGRDLWRLLTVCLCPRASDCKVKATWVCKDKITYTSRDGQTGTAPPYPVRRQRQMLLPPSPRYPSKADQGPFHLFPRILPLTELQYASQRIELGLQLLWRCALFVS